LGLDPAVRRAFLDFVAKPREKKKTKLKQRHLLFLSLNLLNFSLAVRIFSVPNSLAAM